MIESMHRALYAPSREELTPSELGLLEQSGVDVEESPRRWDPMMAYATEFGAILATSLSPARAGERLDARFDHHDGDEPARQGRAVLYGADHPATCLAEVFKKTRVINRWHKDPWLVGFKTRNRTRLVDLTGTFPTRAGASMGMMTGPRSVSRAWARAFHDAWPEIQGPYYPSSMHANRPAMVFTGRAAEAGVVPEHPSLHRSLGDPAIFSILRNAARELGYALL